MSRIKMLFIDIEWNQAANVLDLQQCEIIQIAGIGCLSDYTIERKIFRVVKPKQLDTVKKSTYKLLHLSEKVLSEANPLEVVMNSFFQTFPEYEIMVVWSQDAYDLFEYNIKALGYKMPKHQVVILQEIIGTVTRRHIGNISFKDALKYAKIPYDKNLLHCAKHDANYLQLLFKEVSEYYEKECRKEGDAECYTSKSSKVLHNKGCRYMEAIEEKNLLKVSRKEVLFGAKVCKYCNQQEGFGKLRWQGKNIKPKFGMKPSFEDEYIYAVCDHFGMKCQIGSGVVFVNTGIAAWRIYHNYEEVTKVHHENYRLRRDEYNKSKKYNEGYHKQNIKENTLYEVLHYIANHDKFFFERLDRKKSRVEFLLERVEEERKAREEVLV